MGRGASILAMAVLVGGCRGVVTQPFEGRHAAPEVAFPFAPASMRIHPLSRVPGEDRTILCHLEFRDSWGDTTKAAGQLAVELMPNDEPSSEPAARWDIDLSDLGANARLYDPATRTYRIRLREAPAWVAPGVPGRLRALWRGHDAQGQALVLEDRHEVR